MGFLGKIYSKPFKYFDFFFGYLGFRIFVALLLSLFVGILDGLGLAMFLPLLQLADNTVSNFSNTEIIGNFDFVVDSLESLGLKIDFFSVLSLMVLFFIGKGILKFFESYYSFRLLSLFVKRLRFDWIDKLAGAEYKYFASTDAGKIQNTMSGEIERIITAFRSYMAAVQAVVMVLVYLSLALFSNPMFALLVGIGGGLSFLMFKNIYRKTKATSAQMTVDSHEYHGLLIQNVNHYKYLKATGSVNIFADKLKKSVLKFADGLNRIGYFNSILSSLREPFVVIVVAFVILLQVSYFGQSLGPIILSLMFLYRSLTFSVNLQAQYNNFLNVSGSIQNVMAFLGEISANQEVSVQNPVKFHGLESLEFKKVEFKYGKDFRLHDINMTIGRNQTVALVGPSGSGKTTLVNMIAGLLPVDSGEILVNGTPIGHFKPMEIRKSIGYITQEPVIFNDSIFDNVTFWAEKNPDNLRKFWRALEQASIKGFVEGLDLKEDTVLGNNGILISGGQKQRISIARELFKQVEVLILDEATSALDSESEYVIQENLEKLAGTYTIIIIAHRLSTIKKADVIYLMENGSIVHSGTFTDLIEESSEFKRMVNLQHF